MATEVMAFVVLYIYSMALVASQATNDTVATEASALSSTVTTVAATMEEESRAKKQCAAFLDAGRKCARRTKIKEVPPALYKAIEEREFTETIMECFNENTSPADMAQACENSETLSIIDMCTTSTLLENAPRASRSVVVLYALAVSECTAIVLTQISPYERRAVEST